jgi:hypothetical protein
MGALVRLFQLEERGVQGGELVAHLAAPSPRPGGVEHQATLGGGDESPGASDRVDVARDRVDAGLDQELRVLGVDGGRLAADRRRQAELLRLRDQQAEVVGDRRVTLVEELGDRLGIAVGAQHQLGEVVRPDRDALDAESRVALQVEVDRRNLGHHPELEPGPVEQVLLPHHVAAGGQLARGADERKHYVEVRVPRVPDPADRRELEREQVGLPHVAERAAVADHRVGLLGLEAVAALEPRTRSSGSRSSGR